jgi:PiT family inorganic phosphate transporter
VGAAKRFSAIRLNVVEQIVWAWILTIPISGALAWLFYEVVLLFKG